MTQSQFDAEIGRLLRRVATLKAARDGSLRMRVVAVKRHFVKGHYVRAHRRQIAGKS